MWRVTKPCVIQATGQVCEPGDIVEVVSAFDIASLTVDGAIVPHVEESHETQAVVQIETRRKWGRKGK
jgi:hypothetical protein